MDILEVTPPEGVPGALFEAIATVVFAAYPVSERKAQRVSVQILAVMTEFYEALAKEEDNG